MPASSIFLGFLADRAASLVVKQAQNVLAKMPWAKDAQRVQSVERKIALLVDRVALLARSVPTDAAEPLLEPLIADFRKELLLERIPESEADQIVASVRAQIRTDVLRPLQDASLLVNRIEELEVESDAQKKRIETLELAQQQGIEREKAAEKQVRLFLVLSSVAITVGFLALVVGLIVLGQH